MPAGLWQPWSTRSTRNGEPWPHSPQLPAWGQHSSASFRGTEAMGWGCRGEEEVGDERVAGVEALQSPLSWGHTGVQRLRMLNLHFAFPHKNHLGPPANPLTVPQHPQTLCRVGSEVGPGTGGLTQPPPSKAADFCRRLEESTTPRPPLYIAPRCLSHRSPSALP